MLHLAHQMRGAHVRALDGDVGTLEDFLFEAPSWTVRYLVVHTGPWLAGRRVLLSPMAVRSDWGKDGIAVHATKAQVEHSPPWDLTPLGRSEEWTLLEHYGQPIYWGAGNAWGMFDTPAALAATQMTPQGVATPLPSVDEPLRSTEESRGYHLAAADGEIGHVDDFLIGGNSWRIRYLLVDTSNWIGGRAVVVSTTALDRVDRDARLLPVTQTRDDIRNSPSFDKLVDALDPAETGPPFAFL